MSDLIMREDAINAVEMFFKDSYIEDSDVHCNDMVYEINHIPAASPWHRVEEELPEIGKAVVVSIYDDMWVATRLDDKRFNGRMYWELSDGSWERVENDMYWMPIEPPKEEN